MRVRSYASKDADALNLIYRRSVDEIGRRFYSDEQTSAWLSMTPSAQRLDALLEDGRVRLVAVDEMDRPVAFIDLEGDGHINYLYCSPEAAGRGIASRLYDRIEAHARQCGIFRLFAEASEAALPFFVNKGFNVTEKRAFVIGCVAIHNYAVEKTLAEPRE